MNQRLLNLTLLFWMQDREDPHNVDKTIQGIQLEAQFAAHVDQLRPITQIASMDGFVFNVDPLFQLESGIRWFLQVRRSMALLFRL